MCDNKNDMDIEVDDMTRCSSIIYLDDQLMSGIRGRNNRISLTNIGDQSIPNTYIVNPMKDNSNINKTITNGTRRISESL